MWHYDQCIRVADENSIQQAADCAGKLGWKGGCFLLPQERFEQLKEPALAKLYGNFAAYFGLEITTDRPAQIRKLASTYRKEALVIAAVCQTSEGLRAALETAELDIVLPQWVAEARPQLDHVMAAFAKKNNVAVCLSFGQLLHSSRLSRITAMRSMLQAARLLRKCKAPFVLSAEARSAFDLRAPYDLMAFGRQLGLRPEPGLDGALMAENRKRLSGAWVMPGVEMVK
ncbi:MAG: hypothetical protein HY519_01475 [Candidatus Aenigmarchaeota archaeon]|nr:hypothetical protein [Candidatus Aenigmarchaeota archaeon]